MSWNSSMRWLIVGQRKNELVLLLGHIVHRVTHQCQGASAIVMPYTHNRCLFVHQSKSIGGRDCQDYARNIGFYYRECYTKDRFNWKLVCSVLFRWQREGNTSSSLANTAWVCLRSVLAGRHSSLWVCVPLFCCQIRVCQLTHKHTVARKRTAKGEM